MPTCMRQMSKHRYKERLGLCAKSKDATFPMRAHAYACMHAFPGILTHWPIANTALHVDALVCSVYVCVALCAGALHSQRRKHNSLRATGPELLRLAYNCGSEVLCPALATIQKRNAGPHIKH